jgi:hypothetical protein
MSIVYVNEYFIRSAIIGGVVMGAGFIIGGFCPGTSVCAAAIGKVDAMFFVAGGLIGILFFGQTYAWWEEIYNADYLGSVKLSDSHRHERRPAGLHRHRHGHRHVLDRRKGRAQVPPRRHLQRNLIPKHSKTMNYRFILSLALLFLGFVAAILPQRSNSLRRARRPAAAGRDAAGDLCGDGRRAGRRPHQQPIPSWQLIDLRSPADFADFHLPGALNIPFDSLLTEAWQPYLDQAARRNVFYANGTSLARQAWYLTRQMGYSAQLRTRRRA